jgi:peptide/nickel transport system permease protein
MSEEPRHAPSIGEVKPWQERLERLWSNVWAITRRLFRYPLSAAGVLLLSGFVAMALLAPWIAPPPPGHTNPYTIPQDSFGPTPRPPSPQHILGTTQDQYDIFYGLVWGTRTAFIIGIIVVFCTLFIGIVVGAISGYFGGWPDEIIMRVTEIFLAFPSLVATMVLVTILGKGLDKVVISFIVFGWMGYARLIRGNVLQVKEFAYVEAAYAAGANSLRIIFRHVVPNAIFPILVVASLDTGTVVLGAAALSFLGLGAPEGFADWGQMINFARNWILGTHADRLAYWYTIFFPGLTISLFVLAWNFLGDAVRDILDPRIRKAR